MPPPLPSRKSPWKQGVITTLIIVAVALGLCVLAIVGLQLFGMIRPFSIPSAGMSPTINRGDQIYVERLTYLLRKPRRGDVVIFRTDTIPTLPRHELYVKRLVGLPGDSLSISEGALCVNGKLAIFNNKTITVPKLAARGVRYLVEDWDTLKVPDGRYFVLGDNGVNSVDSRYFGCLPANAVVSRAAFCYSPVNRIGWIH